MATLKPTDRSLEVKASPDDAKDGCIKDILYLLEHMDLQELSRVRWYASRL